MISITKKKYNIRINNYKANYFNNVFKNVAKIMSQMMKIRNA